MSAYFSLFTHPSKHLLRKIDESNGVLKIKIISYDREEHQDCSIQLRLHSGFFIDPCKYKGN